MKYCCDRCEKPIEINVLGNTTGATFVTVKRLFITHMILCKKCANELDEFFDNKGSDEE